MLTDFNCTIESLPDTNWNTPIGTSWKHVSGYEDLEKKEFQLNSTKIEKMEQAMTETVEIFDDTVTNMKKRRG